MRQRIEKEVNRLIFQKQSENILAFRELWEKEQSKLRNREMNKDQAGLTSSHHMALEVAVRRIKIHLQKKKEARLAQEAAAAKEQAKEAAAAVVPEPVVTPLMKM